MSDRATLFPGERDPDGQSVGSKRLDHGEPFRRATAQKTQTKRQGRLRFSPLPIVVVFSLVTLLMLAWVGNTRAEVQPEAAGILARMFKAYASAPAFACEGSCDDQEEGSSLPPDHRTMTVRFVRPDRFRLAWTQKDFHGKSGTSVIYTAREQTFFRQQGQSGDAEGEPSLAQAVSSCAGISLGLSYLVPALLLDDPGYLKFASLRQEPDANSTDGRACWKLAGTTAEGTQWELLIDRETCALREATEINVLSPANATPAHAIHTRYRFSNIQFTDSLPDDEFDPLTPSQASAGKKKR